MTEADRLLGIELCKRFPVDLADAQGIIDFVRESVAQRIEVMPLTYAGPDPQGVSNLHKLLVMAIRDLKDKPRGDNE